MPKLVIVREVSKSYNVVVLDDNMTRIVERATSAESGIVNSVLKGATPLNFSVQGGKIVQDCGIFKRLEHNYISLVVLKVLVSNAGRVIGYRCLNTKTLKIGNTRKEEIISMQSKQGNAPILQNAIIRNGTINSYDNKHFEKEIVGVKPQKQVQTSKKAQKSNVKLPRFMADERLSNTQRRILLEAKKSGAYVEGFNNPDLKPEVMDYYKDVIVNKEIAEDCKPIIDNTKLDVAQIDELYQCAILGIDYTSINDDKLPCWYMNLVRQEKTMEMWGDISNEELPDEDLWNKCVKVAQTLI